MTCNIQTRQMSPTQYADCKLPASKLWQLIMIFALVLAPPYVLAQSSKECSLMKERISGTGNVNAVCSSLFQECMSESIKKPDPKEAQNQCLKNVGDCQMAGQLSGDDLQRVVDQYQTLCHDQ